MLVARVAVLSPLEAVVHALDPDDEWRPLLRTLGPDAEDRAHDLRRQLEAGLLVVAAGAPPRDVPADQHPSLWVRLCDAVAALGERPAATLARIEAGQLRHREDERGIHVLADDLLAIERARLDLAVAVGACLPAEDLDAIATWAGRELSAIRRREAEARSDRRST